MTSSTKNIRIGKRPATNQTCSHSAATLLRLLYLLQPSTMTVLRLSDNTRTDGGNISCRDYFAAVKFAAGISQRLLKKAWGIPRTISCVMLCMAWWTQKVMVYFAKCHKRAEPPQVHALCRGDPSAPLCR